MYRHRFLDATLSRQLPRPQAAPISLNAFCLCPIALMPGVSSEAYRWQQWLYQVAFEQALAVVRPSLPERDLLGHWN
jgi:hypothetical protein